MNGAEMMAFLRRQDNQLTLDEAIEVMATAQEDGWSAFMSNVKQRRSHFQMSYDVYAEQDYDGSWLFTVETMK